MPVAALVLGILGLVISFVPCVGWYALPLTVLGVILGALGMRKPKDGSEQKGKGMAIAGLVCGLIGTLIASYWLWVYIKIRNDVGSEFGKAFREGINEGLRKEAEKHKNDTPSE